MTITLQNAISIRVDPKNPGEFFACCGLLELADRVWGRAEGRFDDGSFTIAAPGSMHDLLDALTTNEAIEMTNLENGLNVKSLIAPLQLRIEVRSLRDPSAPSSPAESVHFTLDAWMKIRRDKGEIVAASNPPWNFWSGRQTSSIIWGKLRADLLKQMKEMVAKGRGFEDLFGQRRLLTGRFGFDPGAAWTALDVGFSPDTQEIPVASSPAVELLAAVGLQRFRPRLSQDRSSFFYSTWGQPLGPAVASAASSGVAIVPPAIEFRGKIIDRGSYSALGYSSVLNHCCPN